jgi:hypothetical protein
VTPLPRLSHCEAAERRDAYRCCGAAAIRLEPGLYAKDTDHGNSAARYEAPCNPVANPLRDIAVSIADMEQKNNLVVSLRCDNSICIRIALELHIILMQWRCPSTNTGSVCVEPRSASSAMMVSYLASRLECVPCRVEYVLPFVDHSLGLPFLVSLPTSTSFA